MSNRYSRPEIDEKKVVALLVSDVGAIFIIAALAVAVNSGIFFSLIFGMLLLANAFLVIKWKLYESEGK